MEAQLAREYENHSYPEEEADGSTTFMSYKTLFDYLDFLRSNQMLTTLPRVRETVGRNAITQNI